MTRRPFFPLYADNFVSGTNGMSRAAVGSFINMLCIAWGSGPVPDTKTALWKALSLGPDDPPFDQVWAEVRPKWVLTAEGWINPRLEQVRAEIDRYAEAQRASGQRGGQTTRRRWQGRPSDPTSDPTSDGSSGCPSGRPSSSSSSSSSLSEDQEQCADAHDFHKILTKLAHGVLDARDEGQIPNLDSELASELKTRAAQARIPYDGRAVAKALESASVQRGRR